MPRRGSRLIFKPSSIFGLFLATPDLVRLDNNFPRWSSSLVHLFVFRGHSAKQDTLFVRVQDQFDPDP